MKETSIAMPMLIKTGPGLPYAAKSVWDARESRFLRGEGIQRRRSSLTNYARQAATADRHHAFSLDSSLTDAASYDVFILQLCF